jgi:2-polyprenyl-3-methyl-5-hydroxy-6-metoxy-1,4-benzoquinol methylase
MPQTTQNINSEFFHGIYKEIWKKETPDALTQAEVDLIEEMGNSKKGHALDFMCGYGRHALELARRGYRVTAIDNLPEYIDELKLTAAEQKLEVLALQADVIKFDFEGKYEIAICMGNSFAFFNAEQTCFILKKLYDCLTPNGIFIFNTWMLAETAIKYFEEQTSCSIDGYKYIKNNRYLFHPTRIETNYIISGPDDKTETRIGIDYIFSFAEMESMLNKNGFEMQNTYSTPRKRKFAFGERRAYIVARKQ